MFDTFVLARLHMKAWGQFSSWTLCTVLQDMYGLLMFIWSLGQNFSPNSPLSPLTCFYPLSEGTIKINKQENSKEEGEIGNSLKSSSYFDNIFRFLCIIYRSYSFSYTFTAFSCWCCSGKKCTHVIIKWHITITNNTIVIVSHRWCVIIF